MGETATEKVKENYEYDKSGNLASFTDQKGNTQKYIYTPFYEFDTMQVFSGKKVVETEKNTYDQTTRQLLTQQNNDTSTTGDTVHVQYPNGTKIEKGFNSFGQTTDVQHFLGNSKAWTEQNQYNGFGNLVETTVNESASTFGYDKLDRIRKEKTPNKRTHTTNAATAKAL